MSCGMWKSGHYGETHLKSVIQVLFYFSFLINFKTIRLSYLLAGAAFAGIRRALRILAYEQGLPAPVFRSGGRVLAQVFPPERFHVVIELL